MQFSFRFSVVFFIFFALSNVNGFWNKKEKDEEKIDPKDSIALGVNMLNDIGIRTICGHISLCIYTYKCVENKLLK